MKNYLVLVLKGIGMGAANVIPGVSGGTIALITFYSSAVLAAWGRAWVLSLVLAAGYLFLYAALKSEDYALLIGSLGLFVILAGVMVLTRNIDWYSVTPRRGVGTKTGTKTDRQSVNGDLLE